MSIILHERNGKTFLNTIKPDVAVSKTTEKRLHNCATIAREWYLEFTQELTETGYEITTLVRSHESWSTIRQRLFSRWKIYSLSKKVVGRRIAGVLIKRLIVVNV